MKKGKLYISILLGLCLCLFTAFFTACGKEETPPAPTLESISVSGEIEVFIDEFDYTDYTITATYSDNSTKTATLTADNLSAEDNAKISTVGTHALTVNYESVSCSWTITLKNHDFAGIAFDDITTTYDGTAKTLAVAGLPTGAQVSYDKATSHTNAGEYTVKATVTLANYNPVELTATLTINKAVYDMSTVEFVDKTVTYNGESHSITATNLPNGVTAQYTGNKQINAGEYEITATFTGDSANYEPIANKTATLLIKKATYDMSGVVFKDKSVNYTGESYSIEATNLPDGVSATYDGNNQSQAGEYTITAHFTGDSANYNEILDMTATLKINASDLTGISFHYGEFTYDGTKKSIFITGTLPDGVKVEYKNNEQINADSYTVTATFTCTNGNYTNLPELTATLLIKKAVYDMSAVVFADKTVTYDGQAHSIEATNLPQGVTAQYTGNKQINAGEYEITATFTGDSQNYELIASQTATLTIEQRELTLAFNGESTLKYNGNAQKTITVQATNLVNGDNVELTVSYNGEMIEVGEYIATATLSAHQNYKLTANNTVKVTITRATHTVTFKQNGFADVTREVLDLADLTDIPTPQNENGYEITWNRTDFTSITDDITVTANKEIITYTVSFDANDGEVKVTTKTYTIETGLSFEIPTRDYYDFMGWCEIGTENVLNGITVGEYGTREFYAKWKPIIYTITYDLNGGVWMENDQNPTVYTIETEDIVFHNSVSLVGYTFAGWYLDEELETQMTGIMCGSHGNKYFYAKWIANLNTLKFDGNGGTGGRMSSIQARTGETIILPRNAFVNTTDYTYGGWATTENGAISYADGSNYIVGTASEQILYAYWKKQTESGFVWSVSNGNITITDYVGTDMESTIPQTIAGYEVSSIGAYAFSGCSGLTSIEIPDGVINIGASAFSDCSSLTNVEIPNSVTSIGAYAFSGCSSLTSIEIPDGVINIGSSAFSDCSSLTNVEIPNSVTSIGRAAFGYCSSLTSIEIPESVTSIGNSAFYECKKLVEIKYNATECEDLTEGNSVFSKAGSTGNGIMVTIGANVRKIPAYLFNSTGTTMSSPDIVTVIFEEGSACDNIGACAFACCNDLTDIEIPDSVRSIGESAFASCKKLTEIHYMGDIEDWLNISFGNSFANPFYYAENLYLNNELVTELEIPNTITEIKAYAFYNCSSLTSVTIGNSVTSIGSSAFRGCSGLMSIEIPDSVTSIGNSAFYGCSSLTSIEIPDSVTSIGSSAFQGCSSLQYTIKDGLKYLGNPHNPYLYLQGTKTADITTTTIENGCRLIGPDAFYRCSGLTSVEIPESVTSIGASAFYGCSSLTSIEIPESVTSIGFHAFRGCTALTEIKYNVIECDSATYGVFDRAGQNGDGIKVIIASKVKILPKGLFSPSSYSTTDSPKIVSVIFEAGSVLESIGVSVFEGCDSLTSIVIPEGVTKIGERAFLGCSSLTSVTMPDSVTSIGGSAFNNCIRLTSVYYKGTAEEWSAISISSNNTYLINAIRYYYSETAPAINIEGTAYDGNYWHYDENGEIVVWVYVKPEV